jgi:hypothetical protein
MPRKPLRAKRQLRAEVEPWMLEYLLHGHVLREDGGKSCVPYLYRREWNGAFCHAAAGAMWEAMREELLAVWVQEHPGTRPWGWWEYDAPEDRPEGEPEAAYLRQHGLLLPGEMED